MEKIYYLIRQVLILTLFFIGIPNKKAACQDNSQKGNFFVTGSLQYSTVKFFDDNMGWNENRFEIGWDRFLKARFSFLFEDLERFDIRDQLSSLNCLYFFDDTSHINVKLSFGHDVVFMHKFRAELEYSRFLPRFLLKNTFVHTKLNFVDYPESNLYVFEIGVTHYYLQHSFHTRLFIPKASARENSLSYMFEWRDSFMWRKITKLISKRKDEVHQGNPNGMKNWFLLGIAYGSRFIDSVPSRKSSDQSAFALYFNIENQIKRNMSLGTNLTYLKEKPNLVLLRGGIYIVFRFT